MAWSERLSFVMPTQVKPYWGHYHMIINNFATNFLYNLISSLQLFSATLVFMSTKVHQNPTSPEPHFVLFAFR